MKLAVGTAVVFGLGIGLGAMLGRWIAAPDAPNVQVAMKAEETTAGKASGDVGAADAAPYKVTTRAYRPPVRKAVEVPSAASPAPDRGAATPPVASETAPVATVEARPGASDARPAGVARKPAAVPPSGPQRAPTWLANAVAAPATEGRPAIAIVMDDLGVAQARTRRTIALPAPLTLAFLPYGQNLPALAAAGRRAGHELLVHVNMEPTDRDVDPGPKALLTSLSAEEVRARLNWAFTRFEGYIGINNHMGSRFTEWPDGMEIVVRELKRRGLVFFDSVTSTNSVGAALARAHGAAHASRDVFLDHDQTAAAIARQLAETERLARKRGYAIAIGHPHAVTLDVLETWLPDARRRGFVMVPLSAIVRRNLGEG